MSNSDSHIQTLFAQALQHEKVQRFAQAERLYLQILELQPNDLQAVYQLGICTYSLGNPRRAAELFQHLLTLLPDHPDILNSLGLSLNAAGESVRAESHLRRSIALRPDFAPAYNNLGITLRAAARSAEAIIAYRQAIRFDPLFAAAHNNLANALRDVGDLFGAIEEFRSAISINPAYAEAWSNLASTLGQAGQSEEAVTAFREAIKQRPDLPMLRVNFGRHLEHEHHIDQALEQFHGALELDPQFREAHFSIAEIHKEHGQIESYLALSTAHLSESQKKVLPKGCLLSLHYHPDFDMPALAREHRNWAAQLESSIVPMSHRNDPSPNRPLRIGYVSSDFRDHVVARNILPLFEHHDRKNFHITCYMLAPNDDFMTARMRSLVDGFHHLLGITPAEMAQRIQDDKIDILVDLSLHSAGNGLSIFAHKPAPLQVSFAGYPSTTGLTRIDYRLTDALVDPPNLFDAFSSEKPFRLPGSFWCYECIAVAQEISPLPALTNGHIAFGCFSNPCKMNRRVLELWAKVLAAVPDSHLHLLYPETSFRENLLNIFHAVGIDKRRIHLHTHLPRDQYLLLYSQIDIMLDTFPYSGHTTSLDSLWMGVPIVTLLGQTPVGRATYSQLTHLKLPELVAQSAEEYITIASALANDIPRLSCLRTTLRSTMRSSILMDGGRFACNIESAYREIWQSWSAAAR